MYLSVSANSVFKHGHNYCAHMHTERESGIHPAASSFTERAGYTQQPVVSHWGVATVLTLQNIYIGLPFLHRDVLYTLDLSFSYPLCRICFRAKSAQDVFLLRS